MKHMISFAKAMLQTARLGAIKATDAATRGYATAEEARWEKELQRLQEQCERDENATEREQQPAA